MYSPKVSSQSDFTYEPYTPDLYKKSNVLPKHRDVTVEQAIFILQR